MKSIISYFLKLDYYSEFYKFEENLNSRQLTFFGAFLTIIIFVSSLVLGIMFGTEIYERKHPFASTSKQYNQNSTVYLKEMPIALGFVTPYGNNFNKIFDYLEPHIEVFGIDSNLKVEIDNSLKLEKCSNLKYDKHQDFVDKISNRSFEYYCINHNNSTFFKNSYTEQDSKFINIYFEPCNNKTKKCPIDLTEKLSNFYVLTNFIDTFHDSYNYTYPVQYYEFSSTLQASNKIRKRQYFRFNNSKYLTDNGWILENTIQYNYIILQDIKYDIGPLSEINSIFIEITFESPKIREITTRNYLKIQELIAKVGGVVKGLHIFASIFTYMYFQYSYRIHIIKLSYLGSNFSQINKKDFKNESQVNLKLKNNNFINHNRSIIQREIILDKKIEELNSNLKLVKENSINQDINKSSSHKEEIDKPDIKKLNLKLTNDFNVQNSNLIQNGTNIYELMNIYKFTDYLKEIFLLGTKSTNFSFKVFENYISENFSISKLLYIMKKEKYNYTTEVKEEL